MPNELAESYLGSPLYMAPEFFSGEHHDGKVDVWSFGNVIFELLTGEPPFLSKNFNEL